MAAKKLQGMPTIQSAVGILLGTFAVIGKQRLRKNRVNRKHLHNFVIRLLSCSFIISFFFNPGTILVVVFVRLSYQNPKEPGKTNQETVPLKISI